MSDSALKKEFNKSDVQRIRNLVNGKIERHSAHIEQQRQLGNIPTGDIYLEPKWNKDYRKMLDEHIEKL